MTKYSGSIERPLLRSLERESDTEWLPDPWNWKLPPVSEEESLWDDWLLRADVPFLGGRRRRVPILGSSIRALLMRRVLAVMRTVDSALRPEVMAYRLLPDGSFEHYRKASVRRAERERQLAGGRTVLLLDLKAFFTSISTGDVKLVLEQNPHWPELSRLLEFIQGQIGYATPEGYTAARSLSNAVLGPIDDIIGYPFTRWVDDYHVFLNSEQEALSTLASLTTHLQQRGFQVSESKTRILNGSDFLAQQFTPSTGPHESNSFEVDFDKVSDPSVDLTEQDVERRVRHALRRAAERDDDSILRALAKRPADHIPVSIIPRLAWALAACRWTAVSTQLFDSLVGIGDDFQDWRCTRLASALWYAPKPVAQERLRDLTWLIPRFPPILLVLLRVAVTHAPEQLRHLESSASGPSYERGWELANLELRGELAVEGPPVRTYL